MLKLVLSELRELVVLVVDHHPASCLDDDRLGIWYVHRKTFRKKACFCSNHKDFFEVDAPAHKDFFEVDPLARLLHRHKNRRN